MLKSLSFLLQPLNYSHGRDWKKPWNCEPMRSDRALFPLTAKLPEEINMLSPMTTSMIDSLKTNPEN